MIDNSWQRRFAKKQAENKRHADKEGQNEDSYAACQTPKTSHLRRSFRPPLLVGFPEDYAAAAETLVSINPTNSSSDHT